MKRHESVLVCLLVGLSLAVWAAVYSTDRMPEWPWRGPTRVVCRPLPRLPSGASLVALTRRLGPGGRGGQQAALIGHDGRVTLLYTDRPLYRRGQVVPSPGPRPRRD